LERYAYLLLGDGQLRPLFDAAAALTFAVVRGVFFFFR
jgi:hypothetical protein